MSDTPEPVEIVPEIVEVTPPEEPAIEVFTADDLQARLAARDAEWAARLSAKDVEVQSIRTQFDAATVERSLVDAAVAGDAHNTEILLAYLRPHTSTVDGQPVVQIEGFTLSPREAVQWMRAQVDRFGSLFRSNIVVGVGSSSTAGGMRGGKALDVRNMGPAEYRAARREGRIR